MRIEVVEAIKIATIEIKRWVKKYVDGEISSLVDSAPKTLNTLNKLAQAIGGDPNFVETITTKVDSKVDKVDGKVLSSNDLTDDLKSNYDTSYEHSQSKHAPIDAEKNVQSDWNETDESSDSYIQNKPISMKNPNSIVFTGAVETSYDGSSTITVEIPTNQNGIHLSSNGVLYFGEK